MNDEQIMQLAMEQARMAAAAGEVPVGAVITDAESSVIAAGHNMTISSNDPTAHAEVVAIRNATVRTGNYRLTGMTLYTTIEPCVMCSGTIVNARITRLVYGAADKRYGAVETLYHICSDERLNHRVDVTGGVMADECGQLMIDFFKAKR